MAHLINNNRRFLCICLLSFTGLFFGCKKSNPPAVLETGTVKDVQGNVYTTVKIGSQWWMSENLKVKCYNDSTPIVEVISTNPDSIWAQEKAGAFCDIQTRYGLYYNWMAVANDKKLAPKGWHIPTDDEWKTLEKELGLTASEADQTSWRGATEGEKLMSKASVGWPTTSTAFGTNESGFSALPGGCRVFNGQVGDLSGEGYWWSSSGAGTTTAWYRNLSGTHNNIFRYYVDKHYGLTIRCVKD